MFFFPYLTYLFFVIIVIMVLVATGFILNRINKKDKNFCMKPFYSKDDFLNEAFSISSIFIFCSISIKLFVQYVNPEILSKTWTGEFFTLGLISVVAIFVYFSKSYISTTLSVYSLYLLGFWSLLRSGIMDGGWFFNGGDSKSSSFITVLGAGWILVNLIMPIAKHMNSFSECKNWTRAGNLLRFIVVTSNVVALSIFSNFYFSSAIGFVFNGNNIFESSRPFQILSLIVVTSACCLAYLVYKKRIIGVSIQECLYSIAPGAFIFILGALFSGGGYDMYPEFGKINLVSGLWLVIFNVLFFVYIIYILINSSRKKESWLRVYAVILMAWAVIYKFFDLSSNQGFNGVFFVIFGMIILVASFAYVQQIKKSKNQPKSGQDWV